MCLHVSDKDQLELDAFHEPGKNESEVSSLDIAAVANNKCVHEFDK
jgi:hypothetical protein